MAFTQIPRLSPSYPTAILPRRHSLTIRFGTGKSILKASLKSRMKILITFQPKQLLINCIVSKLSCYYIYHCFYGLQTPREKFTAWPKIQSQSQIFRYGRSMFCLPHRPNFSDIFDLSFHWVCVVRAIAPKYFSLAQKSQYFPFEIPNYFRKRKLYIYFLTSS